MSTARQVLISGRVQGVGFRWFVRAEAQDLGLAGWVRNLRDGRVEVFIEGREAALEALCAQLRRGPPGARVEAVDVRPRPSAGQTSFELRPTAEAPEG